MMVSTKKKSYCINPDRVCYAFVRKAEGLEELTGTHTLQIEFGASHVLTLVYGSREEAEAVLQAIHEKIS